MKATYREPARTLPVRTFDVVIAGGGTAGVVAALAAARAGARTALVEAKGYAGGIAVEGGTALHSFYNLWKAFPNAAKRQVVKGFPQEIIDRLMTRGGCSGHAEMTCGYDYDSVATCIDTEIYKLVAHEMMEAAGVVLHMNTLVADAVKEGAVVQGVIAESRSGREALTARCFVDCTGYGDLAARAGAGFSEPNDYEVANSIGVGGVSLERFHAWLDAHGAVNQYAEGVRSGTAGRIVRLQGDTEKLPSAFREAARALGMACVTTSVHDDYFMFIKLNYRMPVSPTDRDAVTASELELRRRQEKAVELIREHIPGCGKAFIARTSPSLCIRRGRVIRCNYDITVEDVLEGRHFEDDVAAYGFHDSAPRLQIRDGGTYGIPYRALRVTGLDNLLAAGMMLTSHRDAHMSTRNTVCCMAQGQAAGAAAALCAARGCGTRALPYSLLRETLLAQGVVLEN
jgi:hypothetical protein